MSASRPDSVKRSKKASYKRQLLCWCALYIGLISRRRRGGNTQALKVGSYQGSLSTLASSYNGQGLLIKMNRRAGGIFVYTCTSTAKQRSGSQLYQLARGPPDALRNNKLPLE